MYELVETFVEDYVTFKAVITTKRSTVNSWWCYNKVKVIGETQQPSHKVVGNGKPAVINFLQSQ